MADIKFTDSELKIIIDALFIYYKAQLNNSDFDEAKETFQILVDFVRLNFSDKEKL